MSWQLKRIEQDRPSPITPIRNDRFTVGRASECDFVLTDKQISRRHCTFTASGGDLWIEDENSRNGTAVNCLRIESKTELHAGDAVRVGPYLFLVLRGEDGTDETIADVPAIGERSASNSDESSTDWDGSQTVQLV
jgi:pSer/pThr/pTyr-binding forkhead associated (FHA) protein